MSTTILDTELVKHLVRLFLVLGRFYTQQKFCERSFLRHKFPSMPFHSIRIVDRWFLLCNFYACSFTTLRLQIVMILRQLKPFLLLYVSISFSRLEVTICSLLIWLSHFENIYLNLSIIMSHTYHNFNNSDWQLNKKIICNLLSK